MSDRERVLAELRERARFYAGLDTVGLPLARRSRPAPAAARPQAAEPKPRPASSTGGFAPAASAAPLVLAASAGHVPTEAPPGPLRGLEDVRAWMGDCQRCKLAGTRKTIVFGQGNAHARLMFVGEAPGADEDEQGLAFVGRAGQLLTDIIEKGLKIPRPEVFIANVLKCRPPGNRNPETDEILSCQPFLEKQIELIKPAVLVGLGKFAGQWLLKTAEPISRIRGRVGSYQGIPVIPTYHPAYLLRNPSAKKDVWADMKIVLELLARDPAGPNAPLE
jgi:uracil-DNA glycosylase